jgi:vancomycin resistance protein YoaR
VRLRTDGDTTFLRLVPGRIYATLNQEVSPSVNDTGENARFVFKGGVPELKTPGREGKIVDGITTSLAIRRALVAGKSAAEISFKPYAPPVLTLKDVQKLGIKDLIARGESNFSGSPRNRVKNIGVGRLRYQGILVAPDEEFSFNRYLGLVTAETGYLPELVILENVTTPQYGGGLCQVSTTAFRMAVKAGFDVTARRQHAYPVRYYGKPGFDATIYPPAPDLRFRNNTGHWVLIQTSIEGTKLIFDVYGKSDGRTVTIDGPHITEKRPDGSLRALLRQTVKDKTGNVIHSELFKSEYKSPDLFPKVRQENGEL